MLSKAVWANRSPARPLARTCLLRAGRPPSGPALARGRGSAAARAAGAEATPAGLESTGYFGEFKDEGRGRSRRESMHLRKQIAWLGVLSAALLWGLKGHPVYGQCN